MLTGLVLNPSPYIQQLLDLIPFTPKFVYGTNTKIFKKMFDFIFYQYFIKNKERNTNTCIFLTNDIFWS